MSLNIEQENGGLLFANNSDNPNSPDYNGTINVAGKLFDIALWSKTFDSGAVGFTVKIQEPYGSNEHPVESLPAKNSSSGNLRPRPKPSRR